MARPTRPLSANQRRWLYRYRKMRVAAVVVLAAGALAAVDRAGLFGFAPPPDTETYHDRAFDVVKVVDGDTFDIAAPDGKRDRPTTRVRLWGVDTPETVMPDAPPQHFGPEASAFARQTLLGAKVTLKIDRRRGKQRDKYNRLLAYAYLPDGRMFNELLVAEGYGYADPRFPHLHSRDFARRQAQARRAGKGLWAELTPSDVPKYLRGD